MKSHPLTVDEVKSLNEDICTAQSSVVATVGDTAIHIISVFPKTNLSNSERKTQIEVKAKIKDKEEKKFVSIIQRGNTNLWQMNVTLNFDGVIESYSTPVVLNGYPDNSGGEAYLSDFKHQTMGWSNSWYNGFILATGYFDSSIPDWNNNESNRCITFYGKLPGIVGEQTSGTIQFSQDCFYDDCACGTGNWGGTFTITKIQ
jgi:hypothetical protein